MAIDDIKGFWTGGSQFDPAQHHVVRRYQTQDILDHLFRGREPILVVAPRQSGKSTLLKGLRRELLTTTSNTPDKVGYVSLERYANSGMGPTDFYRDLGRVIAEALGIDPFMAEGDHPEILFDKLPDDTYLLFDEFSGVGSQHPSFFHKIRTGYDTEDFRPRRIRIVLADRSHPSQYMYRDSSPFNIAHTVYLQDFTSDEIVGLVRDGLLKNGLEPPQRRTIIETTYGAVEKLTGGHPYLTQRLGQLIVVTAREQGVTSITEEVVHAAGERLVEDGSDDNFTRILRYVRGLNPHEKEVFGRILSGERVPFTTEDAVGVLYACGLIRSSYVDKVTGHLGGTAQIRNELYKQVFNRHINSLG